MSRWLRNLPIKRKLAVITLCSASAALLAALIAFLGMQVRVARDNAVSDLSALAQIVAANAAAPLVFGDREAGRTTLASLGARKDIERARLVDAAGNEFGVIDFVARPATEITALAYSGKQEIKVLNSKVF